MADETKARSSFLKLLSEPGFDFTPYFDKAVLEWLERNIGEFLTSAPQVCKYFVQEEEFRNAVAANIPLTPEYEPHLITFIKGFKPDWNYRACVANTIKRLHEAKRTDLIMKIDVVTLAQQGDTDFNNVLATLNEEQAATLYTALTEAGWSRVHWDDSAYAILVSRLPVAMVQKVEPNDWYNAEKKTKARAISALATKWPIEDIANFLKKYGTKYSALYCMNCGEKEAKSKPGYTLHRKTCDEKDEYPNIWTIVARRTH